MVESAPADVADADAAAQLLDRQLAEAEHHAGAPAFAEAPAVTGEAAMPDERQLGFDFNGADPVPAAKTDKS